MSRLPAANLNQLYIDNDGHPSDAGNDFAATLISTLIRDTLSAKAKGVP